MSNALLSSRPGKIGLFWSLFAITFLLAFVTLLTVRDTSFFGAFLLTAPTMGIFVVLYRHFDRKEKESTRRKLREFRNGRRNSPNLPQEETSEWSEILAHARIFWTIFGMLLLLVFLVIFVFQNFLSPSPIILYYFVPFMNILIMPFYLFMFIFVYYGALIIPGYLRVKVVAPGDEAYADIGFNDVKAQNHAVGEVKKQINLLDAWRSNQVAVNDFGIKALIGSLATFWFKVPWLFVKHSLKGKNAKEIDRAVKNRIKPQHMLFYGPPGTGKTYLGKAIASEAGELPYILLPATVVHQPFLGVGVILWTMLQNIKINGAAKKYGGVIIIIDEIDSFAAARSGMLDGGAYQEDFSAKFSSKTAIVENECGLFVNDSGFQNYAAQHTFPRWILSIASLFKLPIPGGSFGGAGGSEAVLTQFLMELDGIESPPLLYGIKRKIGNFFRDGLFFWLPTRVTFGEHCFYLRMPPGKIEHLNKLYIGLTNRIQVLDPAIIRRGRLGRHIQFLMPGYEGIKEIAEYYLGKIPHHPDLDKPENLREIASLLRGSAPVMVQDVIESGYHLRIEKEEAYENPEAVRATREDIMEAHRNVKYGYPVENRHNMQSQEETALHECAHAFAGHYFMKGIEEVNELSIVARSDSLGRMDTIFVDELNTTSRDRKAFMARLRVFLAGRIIEEIVVGEQRSGALSDIAIATLIADYMATELMFSPISCEKKLWDTYKEIGEKVFSLKPQKTRSFGMFGETVKDVKHDERVSVFLGQAYVDCWQFLFENQSVVKEMAGKIYHEGLYELSGAVVRDLLNSYTLKPLTPKVVWPEFAYENPFRLEVHRDSET